MLPLFRNPERQRASYATYPHRTSRHCKFTVEGNADNRALEGQIDRRHYTAIEATRLFRPAAE